MTCPIQTTLIADLALARRLERTEALANAEFVAARASAFPESRAGWIECAGAYAMFDGIDSPITQTFGLGLFDAVTSSHLETIESFFLDRGTGVAHEICPLTDVSLAAQLCQRNYRPIEYSNVLYQLMGTEQAEAPRTTESVQVRLIERGEEQMWAETGARGWRDVAPEIDDFLLGLASILPHRTNSYCFVAEIAGQPIAAGGLSLFEKTALMGGACTVPEWRKRGAQRALLAARLAFGAQHDCDLAMVVAEPGSTSQHNAERHGFCVAYTRTKWRLPIQATELPSPTD